MRDQAEPFAAALEHAAQAIFSYSADVPLAAADELHAALTGRAAQSVFELRVRQIVNHGHSADNDDLLPIGWLPMEARLKFDAIRLGMLEQPRDLNAIRALFVEATALGLASIDRLDRALIVGES
jgi:hypothetical protein